MDTAYKQVGYILFLTKWTEKDFVDYDWQVVSPFVWLRQVGVAVYHGYQLQQTSLDIASKLLGSQENPSRSLWPDLSIQLDETAVSVNQLYTWSQKYHWPQRLLAKYS